MSAEHDVEPFRFDVSERVRDAAMSLPDATEGSSCVNRAFRAGGKNFAFLGETDDGCGLRLKLGESLDEVTALAVEEPERYDVGTGGWTMLRFDGDEHPPVDDLQRWVRESYRLLAPRRLVRQLG